MIKITVNDEKFNEKPFGKSIGKITNNMKLKDLDENGLLSLILDGQTVRCGNGGSKESQWESQQVFMIDIDDGLTINEAIEKYSFLSPSFIYTSFSHSETRHKFRLVFIVDDLIKNFDKAKEIQLKLMQLIPECDEKCKNLNRLYFGGKSCVYKNLSNRLNVDYLNDISLKKEVNSVKDIDSIKDRVHPRDIVKSASHKSDTIICINTLYSNSLEKTEMNVNDFYQYLLEQDMNIVLKACIKGWEYKKERETFRCVLKDHKDSNPSAGIIVSNKQNKAYLYNCFGCGRTLNNIQLVSRLYNIDGLEAIELLSNIFNIERVDSEYIARQKAKIDYMINYILSGRMEEERPEIYKFIKRDKNNMIALYEFAKSNLFTDDYKTSDGNAIFYASIEKLCSVLNTKRRNTVNSTIQLFNLLNFITKLAPEELPENILNIAKKHSVKGKITNHYTITIMTEDMMDETENNITILKENKFLKSAMSREYILRTFGKEKADKLYPQHTDKKVSNTSDEITKIIVKAIHYIFQDKNYCSDDDIIKLICSSSDLKMSRVKSQLKRSCKEICDSYGLDYVNCTKENKLKYNLPQELHHAKKVYCKVK